MLLKDLEKLGLNKNQAKVYLALFDLGKTKAGEVIAKTGLHRHLVYQALEELVKQHLATKTTQGKIFLFQITDPTHLLDNIREQNLTAENIIDSLKERGRAAEQNITIYEDKEGVQTFSLRNAENLRPGEVIYTMASGGQKFEALMGQNIKKYFRTIDERGGKIKILMYEGQKYSSELLQFINGLSSVEIRYLPTEQNLSANFVITPNSIGLTILDNPATVIEINSQHLVQAYLAYFEILWSQEIRVARGETAANEAYYKMLGELAPGESYDVLGANVGLSEKHGMNDFYDIFHAKRIAKGVVVNMLSYDSLVENITQRFFRSNDKELKISHIKPINIGLPKSMQVNMYHGKIFITLTGEKDPIIISSEKPGLYQGFKSYFDLLWSQKIKVLEGESAIEKLLEDLLASKQDIYLNGGGEAFKLFTQKFHEARTKNKQRLFATILNQTKPTKLGAIPLTGLRFIEAPAAPVITISFGDKIGVVFPGQEPSVAIREDKEAAERIRRGFQEP